MKGRRSITIAIALLLVLSACGPTAEVTPSNGPGTTAPPNETSAPNETPAANGTPGQPATTDPNVTPVPIGTPGPTVPPPPLPEAELTDPNDITSYLGTPGTGIQATVSMLRYLGIGIYRADGSPVAEGTEAGPHDLFLYEDEVRELAEMGQFDQEEDEIPFSDFHESLTHFGVTMTEAELVDHYESAYAGNPDAPISQMIDGLGGVSVDFPISRLMAWLLFVDGFVPPNGSTGSRRPSSAGGSAGAGAGQAGWGVAPVPVPQLITLPFTMDPQDFPLVIAHLMLVVGQATVVIDPSGGVLIHEGHGAPGPPHQFQARVTAPASIWISPITGSFLMPVGPFGGNLSLLPVTWSYGGPLLEHGTVAPAAGSQGAPNEIATTMGPSGEPATITFTPKQETANGEGHEVSDGVSLRAEVIASELLETIYGAAPGSLIGLVGRQSRWASTSATLAWHEARTMHIELVSEYVITIDLLGNTAFRTGTDTFEGDLAQLEDGSWRGLVTGTSDATDIIDVFGRVCDTDWSGTQMVQLTGTNGTFGDYNFLILFAPVSAPSYTSSPPTCYEEARERNGIDYLLYNNAGITDSDFEGPGVGFTLPEAPGGTNTVDTDLPEILESSWTITVEYNEPAD